MTIKRHRPLEEWGQPIEIDGAWLPDRFTVVTEYDDPPITRRLRICLINGQWQATELSFSGPDDRSLQPELIADTIRLLPKIVQSEVLAVETEPGAYNGRPIAAEDRTEYQRAVRHRQRRRLIDNELLTSVAEVYESTPDRPAKAVEEHFVVSAATASRWINLARERGFLEPRGS